MLDRRDFVGAAGLGLLGADPRLQPPPMARLNRPAGPADQVARDESYWRQVAAQYQIASGVTNLEAGYFGMMAAPVLAAYHRHVDRVNRESSQYARRGYEGDLGLARSRVAAFLGVKATEIAFTRSATEALQCLIAQYNRLTPGDEVLYADTDYMAMQYAMNWLAERRGVTVARVVLPEPGSRDGVLAAYAEALAAHPKTKLVLLTHLNNKNGLIIPVKEIAALARAQGAEVIVDAAHSFGQTTITMDDLGADFVGLNLHKWIGAPIGVGVMFIREGRLADVDRMYADESSPAGSIQSRVHMGTANFAAYLTVPHALDFHEAVGPAAKAARLRYLRDRWVSAVRGTPEIEVLTPDEPGLVGAITSFRLHGRGDRESNQAVARELIEKHRLFTVWRNGLARGDCVRVTPALYNTLDDCDRLASALVGLARRG